MLASFEFISGKSFRDFKEELSVHFTDLDSQNVHLSNFIDLSIRWTDSVMAVILGFVGFVSNVRLLNEAAGLQWFDTQANSWEGRHCTHHVVTQKWCDSGPRTFRLAWPHWAWTSQQRLWGAPVITRGSSSLQRWYLGCVPWWTRHCWCTFHWVLLTLWGEA